MYVRLNTIEGSLDRMDDFTTHIQEQTLPQLRQMDGFKGFVALGDRRSGKLLGVSFWESEEALRATEQPVSSMRSEAADAAGGTLASVEQYEVLGVSQFGRQIFVTQRRLLPLYPPRNLPDSGIPARSESAAGYRRPRKTRTSHF